jgi:hypothetical protein
MLSGVLAKLAYGFRLFADRAEFVGFNPPILSGSLAWRNLWRDHHPAAYSLPRLEQPDELLYFTISQRSPLWLRVYGLLAPNPYPFASLVFFRSRYKSR